MQDAERADLGVLRERLRNQGDKIAALEQAVNRLASRLDDEAKAETTQLRAALIFIGSILLSVLGYLWFARNNLP